MKNIFMFVMVLVFGQIVQAGHDQGGGGIGIPIDKNIYLFDFVEAGIEQSVYIHPSIPDAMGALPFVQANVLTTAQAQNLITSKLNEIYRLSPTLSLRLLSTIMDYQWRLVSPRVRKTSDLGETPIYNGIEEKQIAFRNDAQKVVTIDREYFNLMPVQHQVGLIFHEIIYALSADTDSSKARIFTSYLFHPSFAFQTFEQLKARAQLSLPSVDVVSYDEYQKLNSDEFKKQCQEFQTLSTSKIENALLFYDTFVIRPLYLAYQKAIAQYPDYDARVMYIETYKQDIKISAAEFNYNSKVYIKPESVVVKYNSRSVDFGLRFSQNSYLCITNGGLCRDDRTKLVYRYPESVIKKHQIIRDEMALVANRTQNEFMGQCLDQESMDLANTLKTLSIEPVAK